MLTATEKQDFSGYNAIYAIALKPSGIQLSKFYTRAWRSFFQTVTDTEQGHSMKHTATAPSWLLHHPLIISIQEFDSRPIWLAR